jgi:hypothetical protein
MAEFRPRDDRAGCGGEAGSCHAAVHFVVWAGLLVVKRGGGKRGPAKMPGDAAAHNKTCGAAEQVRRMSRVCVTVYRRGSVEVVRRLAA